MSFQRDIRPILSDKCFACHGPDAETREADLRLDDRGVAIHVLTPENPDESELLRRITSKDPDEQMPPPEFKNRLTSEEIESLRQWVTSGSEYQNHWSFQPVGLPKIPQIDDQHPLATWPVNAIDQWVLEGLLKQGKQPSPPATRSRWLRRVYFDLIGLPPTPE
ncbi:MAG: c-type cytochrome domain-containing protein, partial [Planctomycetota bacterium]|nr:c-type cytochrome domain-containing protein [Planctomycetota bacterium]